MPRRRPAQVRADALARLRTEEGLELERASRITGLSPYGRLVVMRLERARWRLGITEDALRMWGRFVRTSGHGLWNYEYEGCGIWECCPDYREVRGLLEAVAHHLPPKDARRFRRRLAALDAQW